MNIAPEFLQEEDEGALWAQFKHDGSALARERLFVRNAAFARNIAKRHHRERSRGDLDLHDLQQLAYAGLLESLDRFDPKFGVPFRAFASHRISGSIRDGIVHMNEVREQMSWRHRVRKDRMASLSDAADGALQGADAMAKLAEIAVGLALGFMLEGTGLFIPGEGEEQGDRPDTAYDSLAWKEIVAQLHAELSGLPEREQAILRRHYLDGVNFDDLATLFGVTKGRVSQLHRAALVLLRKRMSERGHFRLGK